MAGWVIEEEKVKRDREEDRGRGKRHNINENTLNDLCVLLLFPLVLVLASY